MNGSYFPDKNIYLVENESEDKLSTYSGNTMSSEANSNPTENLSPRSYIFIPHFSNSNLYKLKIK